MDAKKKPWLGIVLGAPKKDVKSEPEHEEDTDAEPVDREAKRAAVKDLFRAMRKDDVDAGVDAFDALMEACGYGEEPADDAAKKDDKDE